MSLSSVAAVFSNADLIIQIYQRLDLESQLRLSRVNTQLASVFHTFIFKVNYQTLNIFENCCDFFVADETQRNQLRLNFEGLLEFFNVYAHGVEKLSLRNINVDVEMYGYMTTELTFGQMILYNLLNMDKFKSLKSLTYHFMRIPHDHMTWVADLCPDLEELSITNCSLGNSVYWIMDKVLPRMRKIKYLSLKDGLRFRLPFSKFQELVHQGDLETLDVSAVLEPGEGLQQYQIYRESHLRELHVEATFEAHKWPNNFQVYLGYFKNLVILQVEVLECITIKTLAILEFACKELRELNIKFSRFDNVTQMLLPPKLRGLSLNCCRGLSHTHLQQLLTQFKLTKFSSKETVYEGEFLNFTVSPLLECLDIDAVYTHAFKFESETNDLKELTWHHPGSKDIDATSLEPCRQLRILYIEEGYVDLNSLTKLKSLTNLSIPHPIPLLSWSYIISLLMHSSLTKLSIRSFSRFLLQNDEMMLDVPNEGVETGIVDLQIPLDIWDLAMKFWLDVLRFSKKLKTISCTFYPSERYAEFLIRLLHHAQFPKGVRNIDVCGLTINCNKFRRNPTDFLEKLSDKTKNTHCWHDDDLYMIVIEKKN